MIPHIDFLSGESLLSPPPPHTDTGAEFYLIGHSDRPGIREDVWKLTLRSYAKSVVGLHEASEVDRSGKS